MTTYAARRSSANGPSRANEKKASSGRWAPSSRTDERSEMARLSSKNGAEYTKIRAERDGRNRPPFLHEKKACIERFTCGEVRYAPQRAGGAASYERAAHVLGLSPDSSTDTIERWLHIVFQRMYHKPPHERTAADQQRWDALLSVIDINAYERENSPPECRVGKLILWNEDIVKIHWYGGEDEEFDFRDVPSEVIDGAPGATVHAVFRRGDGGQMRWESLAISPRLESDVEILADDARALSLHGLAAAPPADWPKLKMEE